MSICLSLLAAMRLDPIPASQAMTIFLTSAATTDLAIRVSNAAGSHAALANPAEREDIKSVVA